MVFLLLTFYKLGWLMLFMRQVLVFWLAVFLVLITFFLNNSGVGNLVCMPIRRYPLWSTWQFDETHNHAIKFYPNQNIPNRLRMCSRMTELCSCKATSIICWQKWRSFENTAIIASAVPPGPYWSDELLPHICYLLDELPLYLYIMVAVLRRLQQHCSKHGNPEINTPSD